jgi:hypothetical protein
MTFFTTQRGYMGMSADTLQAGDRIMLISGVAIPMVVRFDCDGSYRLVAPAYIHGIMSGELWPESDGDLSEFIFN